MNPSSSSSGPAANLHQAMKNLNIEWQQTKGYWRDVKSQDFERHYLEQLPHDTARAIAVMEEISAILKKVRSDCE